MKCLTTTIKHVLKEIFFWDFGSDLNKRSEEIKMMNNRLRRVNEAFVH